MFKPSPCLCKAAPSSIKRLPLSTKQAANKGGYYKGTGVGSMGWHTKHGKYIIDLRKVRTFVPPADDEGGDWKVQIRQETLTPFVSKHIDPPEDPLKGKGKDKGIKQLVEEESIKFYGKMTGKKYLDMWKQKYNEDVQLQSTKEERK